jgi:hypothetical protein
MQPDGRLNRSPTPKELWALGEGYAAFRGTDPGVRGFLRARMDLAIGR